jgi:microcin C transport system substrate-binding protein
VASPSIAAPQYYLTQYGEPKYAADFKHFEYADPNAKIGGSVTLASPASFDSLNPFIIKGVPAPGIGSLFESLMTQSLDEPNTLYGLVAESVDVSADRKTAEFTLRKNPAPKWHDGTPITPDDVVFSFITLKEKGDPIFKVLYTPIEKVEKTGERSVKFTFSDTTNREIPIIAASMPILSKAYYAKQDFTKTSLESPLGSGPYKVKSIDQGRRIVYVRVKDYWGKDLPVNVGSANFDEIRYDIYLDETVALEAFKAGNVDFREEFIARNWATAYDFPALKEGKAIKRLIQNSVPTGMQCFVMNSRKPYFSDRRVREAIGLTLDFEWTNKTLFFGTYKRNSSYFMNTEFASSGLPSPEELKLLEPFKDKLAPSVFTTPFAPPVTDGSGNPREQLKKADTLLTEAGWVVKDGVRVNAETGQALTFEFLLNQQSMERVIAPMRKNLERLGIKATIRMVDDAQYVKRLETYDYDIISQWLNRKVYYPGVEQKSLWYSAQADIAGATNYAGAKNPAIDALIDKVVGANDLESLRIAARTLDRVLLSEHYIIPNWHASAFRVAYWDKFGMPAVDPKYALGFGFWWLK